jgi:hypothetical protein
MASESWFERIRALDVRLLAAVAATILLVIGVMWVVPTTPNSNSFTFDSARRGIEDALPIELAKSVDGSLVDGSDSDFYRIDPMTVSYRLDVRLTNGSTKLIPGLRIFDMTKTLVQEHAAEYVKKPGASIDASFIAQSKMTYYVQVFSQRNTTGSYSLSVSVRQP